MKKIAFVTFFTALALISCTEKKGAETPQPADSTAVAADNNNAASGVISVTGNILEIENGKDGYTAKIKDAEGSFYKVVLSRINLEDPSLYREATVGQQIMVTGEQWEMNGEVYIKAVSMAIN